MDDTKKSRGRPRKLDPHDAAKTAMELFWRKGYDAVGIAELTDALGVKSPSLYAAFGSKANLFAAALDAFDRLTEPHFSQAFMAKTLQGFVTSLLQAAAELYTTDPSLPGCLIMDGDRNSTDPEAQSHAASHRTSFAEAVQERLKELGAQHPKRLAQCLIIALYGLSGATRNGTEKAAILASATILSESLLVADTAQILE